MKLVFEERGCRRCDGSGRYGGTVDGGVCYDCRKTGKVLTADGNRANDAFRALLDERLGVDVTQVRAGDFVWMKSDGFSFKKSGWYEVLDSHADKLDPDRWVLEFAYAHAGNIHHMPLPGTRFRIHDRETIIAIMREIARDYPGATLEGE